MAHELAASTGKEFAVCLSRAWALYRLSKRMKIEIVSFAYEKKDGSLRKAKGTLKDAGEYVIGKDSSIKTMKYFDVEANGFRSFRIENLITIY